MSTTRPAVLSIALCLIAGAAAGDDVSAALRGALARNTGHARNWLAEKDYKSLAQSVVSLNLLGELLGSRGDDPGWKAASARVAAAIAQLQEAARGEDAAHCGVALEALDKALAAMDSLSPAGKPQPLPRGSGVRPLMMTMDGIYADAKIALIAGDVAAAKNQARVLAELGQIVSNSRTGEPWTRMAGAFSQAAQAAAASAESDPQKFRAVLRGISQRCDACHEVRDAAR